MKKMKYLVLLIALLLFPSIVNAEGNIAITKIVKKDITGYAYELNPPTFSGLTINYDLSFHSVGDSVTYIATVQNSDKEAYKIENKNSFSPSGYMTYEFKFSDNTNTIKANETKDMYITIKYNKEVPIDKLVNGEYKEQNQMDLILVNSNGQILNPNTSSTILFILLIGIILLVSIITFKKHKKISVLLLTIALLIPITTYALKEIKITLNTQVVIEKDLKFCIYEPQEPGTYNLSESIEPPRMYFNYTEGETLENWLNNNPAFITEFLGNEGDISTSIVLFISNEYNTCINNVLNKYGLTWQDLLKSNRNQPDRFSLFETSQSYGDKPSQETVFNEISNCSRNYVKDEEISSIIKGRNEGCFDISPLPPLTSSEPDPIPGQ